MTRNPVGDNTPFSAVYWSAILNGHNHEGVLSGLVPSLGTGDWDVDYTTGSALADGSKVNPGAGTVTLTAADATNTRVDLITVDAAGSVEAVAGTPAADPLAPDIPAGETLIAVVVVPGGATSLTATNINDYRVILGIDNYPLTATDLGSNSVGTSELQSSVDASFFSGASGSAGEVLTSDGTNAPWGQVPRNVHLLLYSNYRQNSSFTQHVEEQISPTFTPVDLRHCDTVRFECAADEYPGDFIAFRLYVNGTEVAAVSPDDTTNYSPIVDTQPISVNDATASVHMTQDDGDGELYWAAASFY